MARPPLGIRLASALLAVVALCHADEPPSLTLMDALAGATYVRQIYDEGGGLRRRQILAFGPLQRRGSPPQDVASLPVTITDDDDTPEVTRAVWQCDGDALAMLMSVGTYAGSRGNLRVTLQAEGSPILYPAQVTQTDTLTDLEFSVKGDRDVLGLLGSRTKLTFSHRVVKTLDTATGAYRVTSTVVARTYVLGVPVKVAHLRSAEWVHPDSGLIRHRLTAQDGRVWQLERRDSPLAPAAGTG